MKRLILCMLALVGMVAHAQVRPGIETLREEGFRPLRGKTVGLVTNPTGVDSRLVSTVDILAAAPGVTLGALFAPEHGVRGDVPAGARVANATDPATGVRVYSLYGATKKPTAQMLKGLDIIVYDIQDIGCRSYTFISTLGKLMEACVENGLELMVLDRPNPLGGERVEGPYTVDPAFRSFVSQYSIPYVYALTPGELAIYLNNTEFGGKCKLKVQRMAGWKRSMTFDKTGLPWVPTSPNIPSAETAIYYPATGIMGELGTVGIGANFTLPFRVALGETLDADALCGKLRAMDIPGTMFRPCHMKIAGKQLHGVEVYLAPAASLVMTQFHILQAVGKGALNNAEPARVKMFDKVCGSAALRRAFLRGGADAVRPLVDDPEAEARWREATASCLLY